MLPASEGVIARRGDPFSGVRRLCWLQGSCEIGLLSLQDGASNPGFERGARKALFQDLAPDHRMRRQGLCESPIFFAPRGVLRDR